MKNNKKSFGFSLIEVLIAVAILSVGLLGVAVFQGELINSSASNKARAEALALAQARLEEMRNYTDTVKNVSEFDTLFTVTTGFGSTTAHNGVNAVFSRQEAITQSSETKEIAIKVSWQDGSGQTEEVIIQSELGFKSPSLVGELDDFDANGPLVRSATGRAELGEGEVKVTDTVDMTQNGDNTGILDRGDGDLRLTNGGETGDDVVLTLKDACELDTNGDRTTLPCTGFVEISGRVYIDTASQSRVTPGDIYVKASDAAYCQRYYYNADAEPIAVDSSTTNAHITANSDYKYFDYTCYLGGGWHGNIGLVLEGGITRTDKVCVGDPTSVNPWEDTQIAGRRVYRGMAHDFTDDTNTTKLRDANDDIIYYSIGVSDALVLPAEGDAGHDFVLAGMGPGDNDGELCTSEGIMVRTDANVSGTPGSLFSGVPTDFFCLNIDSSYVDQLKLDIFGYGIEDFCPFNPSDPPSERHEISGVVNLASTSFWENNVYATRINTSDGLGNCRRDYWTKPADDLYSLHYTCDIYDWGNGWTGFVQITPDTSLFSCTTLKQNFSDVITDTTINDFSCANDDTGKGTVTIVGNITKTDGAIGAITISDATGSCLTNSDGTGYSCTSAEFDAVNQWSGKIMYSAAKNKNDVCVSAAIPAPAITPNIIPGKTASIEFTDVGRGTINVDIEVIGRSTGCAL
ncbi:prepilin-type N-terminal cleavage/methylation domain-containing protein [Thalassotalea litorea]|uniref:Prepilin-type N-terminal cleavage/methylation domain-containing protein n=1 Tax=Thalassotalea litorea TaxID=2020715 RepID=A0A5R9IH17_9GAMM|nr:prepilin-type N-terminal cleavage/methylation domain-containing protein [Thalassotalea litorea]TLU61448.1 prepilin-type N-terminal cleavage/methylation domain-containing protein [Thalassotalea litorea]